MAQLKTFKARISVSGHTTEVRIQAENSMAARALLEAQYGKKAIFMPPTPV